MLSLRIITPLVILMVSMTTAKHVREGRRRHLRKDSDVQQHALRSTPSSHHGSNRNAALIASLLDALSGDNNIQIIINTNSGNTETTTNNDNSNSKYIVAYDMSDI
jgi:hypothetical protein